MIEEERYPFRTNLISLDYEFESVGPKGIIKKLARFNEVEPRRFIFGFGNVDEVSGDVSDTIVSDNNDTEKVLVTVAHIIFDFISINPFATVFVEGSTSARTRLYQIGINKHWEQIKTLLNIYGLLDKEWVSFQPGRNYEAFLAY